MQFTSSEIQDLLSAIGDAQSELCVDLTGSQFPEGTAYYRRLEALAEKLRREGSG